jgi:hypothetical protein
MNTISLMFCVILKCFRKLGNITGKTGRSTHTHTIDLQALRDGNLTSSQTFYHLALEEKQAREVSNILN